MVIVSGVSEGALSVPLPPRRKITRGCGAITMVAVSRQIVALVVARGSRRMLGRPSGA
jgi:hypothetical protein